MENQKILAMKTAHKTTGIVLYNIKNLNVVKFFELMDIWGSGGYDRFNDEGLYFEVPLFAYENIEQYPFVNRERIDIIKA